MTRTILRRSRVWSFPAVFAAVVLAGCTGASGDSGTGAASPSPSQSSASATPTPTPTPSAVYKPASAEGPAENVPLPAMPEEAKVESKEGLEAFARYWYELVNYGYETGDTEPIRAISGPDCAVCKNFYEMVGKGYSNEDWISGGRINVQGVASEFVLTPEGRYQVLIQNTQAPLSYYGPGTLYGARDGYEDSAVQMIEARYTTNGWYAEVVVTIQG
ncbi:DUF6318 family protein [Arthrobacter sp. zg-Y20]|uniref:DUF6318 family protein n=1 Tax=unclassified Arthrobacter TaxID=235627 RepID=UPI001D140503|nr:MULTISPECIES: DUF6318 family protein [unclassified Arthrobacter]MCC3277360.1 DUF6318 family protein [Arthrobacter sp. zg-Y20]MDK1317520.1 DUF6318 family protein [Arthrobacter sp. zg.Y20]WIB06981.1 DUF6318 family protein [Arthrobacter sp. zg-Y20]